MAKNIKDVNKLMQTLMGKTLMLQEKEVLVVNLIKHMEMLLLAYHKLKSLGLLQEYLDEMTPANRGLARTLLTIYQMAGFEEDE